jgi:hypothetical protein
VSTVAGEVAARHLRSMLGGQCYDQA